MQKTPKTSAEILDLVRAEEERHGPWPQGLIVTVLRVGDSWELRTSADQETSREVGYGECVARIVQIGDHLRREFDLRD
jgi:hypothetical protein